MVASIAQSESPAESLEAGGEPYGAWAETLATVLHRVAILRVEGTSARVVAQRGIQQSCLDRTISLVDPTPLRWAVEAASPIINAGASPGGAELASALGLTRPRAYAVVPLATSAGIVAIAYGDHESAPLPLGATGALFACCAQVLQGERPNTRIDTSSHENRRVHRTRRSRPLKPTLTRASEPRFEEPDDTPETIDLPSGGRWFRRLGIGLMLGLCIAALMPFSPIPGTGEIHFTVPPNATVQEISMELEAQGVIRSAAAFRAAAWALEIDRNLRSGIYVLPPWTWAWSVLGELHKGQVQTRSVTVPEGMNLPAVARLLELEGFTTAVEFIEAATDSELLRAHGIEAASAEGFLFPETYSFAVGLSARHMVSAMLNELFRRLEHIPSARGATPREIFSRITLASIVERESKRKDELGRIAGVFANRLERNMRLESCATVQYVLGAPKEKLSLQDIRTPSPFNTYLHGGLPPGPISNPGVDALIAAFEPERHDFLFFFANPTDTDRHVFTRSFAEHQRQQRALKEDGEQT